mmetsp:Transcript_1993/g.6413  ORF Transcript_1993/g.6413 Transcript_1993/m.6413 type:complete len:273 (-) Transcript_1993:53-871(-)
MGLGWQLSPAMACPAPITLGNRNGTLREHLPPSRPRPAASGRWLRRAFLRLAAGATVVVASGLWASGAAYTAAADPAVRYYTKALRGAADIRPGTLSRGFQRLARLHYTAVRLRRARDFGSASAVYQQAIRMQRNGKFPQTDEVTSAVAAAHASLNLALTQQAQGNFVSARRTFQDGAAMVQELIYKEFHAWVDGHNKLHFHSLDATSSDGALQEALKWLATLLTAWALLETKRGKAGPAKRLAQRAASLDKTKACVLRWKKVAAGELAQTV